MLRKHIDLTSYNVVLIRIVYYFLQTAWIVVTRSADYKPLQFLAFAFVYRLFEKLKSFESPKSSTINVSFIFYDSKFNKILKSSIFELCSIINRIVYISW
jgi:hypothetical protein